MTTWEPKVGDRVRLLEPHPYSGWCGEITHGPGVVFNGWTVVLELNYGVPHRVGVAARQMEMISAPRRPRMVVSV